MVHSDILKREAFQAMYDDKAWNAQLTKIPHYYYSKFSKKEQIVFNIKDKWSLYFRPELVHTGTIFMGNPTGCPTRKPRP